MPTLEEVKTWNGREVLGPDEDKLGKIDAVYLDRQTGEPTFASIKTGLFGTKSSLVPIAEAKTHEDHVHVPYDKATVKDAPNIDADEELSEAEEQRLYAHYGQEYSGYEGADHESFGERERVTGHPVESEATAAAGGVAGTAAAAGTEPVSDTREDVDPGAGTTLAGAGAADAAATGQTAPAATGETAPAAEGAVTRSEEELTVGTQSRETGRARLRKYIVTEQVQTTIPVSHEEVRVEREPITGGTPTGATELSEEEREVTLHAEEPVVQKQVVPKERVRLETETVTGEAQVDETVRKEQVDVDGADARP